MGVLIGGVTTFPHVHADKEQAVKVLEEASEVHGAWEQVSKCGCTAEYGCPNVKHLVDECADLITATCNLLYAIGVTDMRDALAECEERNRQRGRL